MKIKSIAAICKKNKNIAIFERYSDDGDILTQYIGDGSAVYPVVGLPQLDKESLLTIFDVPEKDRNNYFVKTLGVPVGISFEDTDETERHVEREGISIIYSGRTLKPIRTTRGLVFIESRYLSPVADVLDVLELYERRTAEGAPYIVAKAGFLLQAVIMPYDVINQQFVESLQSLTRECEFSLSEKERREREARDRFTFTEPEQCSLNVDPDTGKVVEESEVADEWTRRFYPLKICAGVRRKTSSTSYKECPHCGAHLDSGEKCECRAEEIEAKNSQKYACGLTEQDVESGWECPLDNPNETVERCEDCAFAKETD